jgi:hypothetical protein
MWKEQGRSLTEEEENAVIKDAEKAYNRKIRLLKKLTPLTESQPQRYKNEYINYGKIRIKTIFSKKKFNTRMALAIP